MNKLIPAFCLTIISSVFAFAQTTDYKKSEFFVGYSNGQVDTGANSGDGVDEFFDDRLSFHGFNGSAVVNVNRYVGIKGDVSGTYKTNEFSFPVTTGTTTNTVSFKTKSALYNFLGGVQVKDNASTGRLKPFAYALAGVGHGRIKVSNVSCPLGVDCSDFVGDSETGLAGAFGGGLDIRVNDNIDFRVVKVDYNPIRFDSGTQHNIRLGIGVVFK
ncbi:MAG TPA: outer membrane beta-barrel protein [Pyrinomonadaceae bacterium]|jgi:opacity protein-like surface antigen